MKIIKEIMRNPAGSILEMISIFVSVIFLTSLSGTITGIVVLGITGIAYEMLKVWMIMEVKRFVKKGWKVWFAILWRSLFLGFLITVALIASLSYALSTIDAQRVKKNTEREQVISQEQLKEKVRLERDLFTVNTEMNNAVVELEQLDSEIEKKLEQIAKLPPGWISASDRLSAAVSGAREEKRPLNAKVLELTVRAQEIQMAIDVIELELQVGLSELDSKFGAVASEEFMRVASMLKVDPEQFLKIFMLAILTGVELGIIMLLKPNELQAARKAVERKKVEALDPVLSEMDKVIDAMLSRGTKKLPGVGTISKISGVSIPRVSAYRAAFIQHGFIKCGQGASSAIFGNKEMKIRARKVRDKIDF